MATKAKKKVEKKTEKKAKAPKVEAPKAKAPKAKAPKKVAEIKAEKPAEVPAKEVKQKEVHVVKQGQVNEIAATVRKIKNWLEVTMGADIDGDGKLGMTYLPVMVLVLAAALIGGMIASADESIAVRYMATRDCDNLIELNADNADDTDDQLQLIINTDNDFSVTIGGNEVLNITKDGAMTATTITADATNYTGGVSADSYIRLIDTDSDATITSKAATGDFDGILALDADAGEDNEDTWFIKSEATGNDLSIVNHATERLNLTKEGLLQVDAGVSAGDAVTLTDANGAAVISAIGLTGDYDASLILDADGGDDAADTWTITSEGTGNDLSVLNAATEVLNLNTSGDLQIDGDLTVSGNDIESGAATMTIGASAATRVEIADTGIITDIKGPLSAAETLAVIGVTTLGEDVDVNLDAADEEIRVDNTAIAHTEASSLVKITDAAIGATATETDEATLEVNSKGVYGISITDGALYVEGISTLDGAITTAGAIVGGSTLDVDSITVDADKGIDCQATGTLLIGAATADIVEISVTGVETDIQGTLSVDEAAVFDSTVEVTGVMTLTEAPIITAITTAGTATVITTNAPAVTEETPVWVTVSYGGSDYVMPIWLKD